MTQMTEFGASIGLHDGGNTGSPLHPRVKALGGSGWGAQGV